MALRASVIGGIVAAGGAGVVCGSLFGDGAGGGPGAGWGFHLIGQAGARGTETVVIGMTLALAAAVLGVLWLRDVIRPGSFRRGAARRVSGGEGGEGVPGALWLLCGGLTFFVWIAAAAAVMSAPGLTGGDPTSLRGQGVIALVSFTVAAVMGGVLVSLLAGRAGTQRAGVRLRGTDVPVGLGAFLVAAPVVVAVMMLSPLVYRMLTGEGTDAIAHETLRQIRDHWRTDPWVWVMVAGAVLAAPVAEELIYRVFLQTGVLALTGRHWLAILGVSAVFAMMHRGAAPVYALPPLFVLSVAMGVAYDRTGRLGVPIVMHTAFNAGNVAAVVAGG